MASLTLHAHGNATPAQAWDRYRDTRRWSQWSPQIRSVRTDTGPLIEAGLTGTVRPVLGPGVRFQVVSVDESARTWSWRVRLGPLRFALDHAVTAHPDGCATSLTIHGPAPVVAGYAPLAWLALRKLVGA